MDENFGKIFDEARRLSLTADEKSAGREMLRSYMALTPMRVSAEASVRQAARKPVFGFASPLIGKAMSVFSLVLAFMISAGSVSYAAEGSLPGDVLYPVKVGINEEVRATLAPTAQAKAAWEAERAERRLAEAETLATRGELGSETRVALEADFHRHAGRAKNGIARFTTTEDLGIAADISAHFEGSLQAHKKIMAMLAADADDDDDTEVEALEASIDDETADAEEARGKREEKIAAEAATEVKSGAEGRRGAALHKIAEVRAYLSKKRADLGADATARAEVRLAAAEATVAEGNASFDAGQYGAAFAAFAKAQRQAQEAKLLIRADHDLKVRIKAGPSNDGNAKDDAGTRGDERRSGRSDEAANGGSTDDAGKDRGRDAETNGDLKLNSGDGKIEVKGDAEARLRL
ncbi:MAG TPA: DUF5667 domain-containing protein [Candidatus Eisenbacteria bacterium]|nr:DUF5667 domain-containing protein [Candidatus Eisenbacteria bacterium]